MSRSPDNILRASDTWGGLIDKFNAAIDVFEVCVTVSTNSTPDMSYGNGFVTGILGANTIVASIVRGGNVTSSDYITFASNSVFTGAQINVSTANVMVNVNGYISVTNSISIGNTTVNSSITGNTYTGTANNSLYLGGKAEAALNVNNSVYLNSQPGSYYTNATNLATGTVPNARLNAANTTLLGIVQLVESTSNTSITLAPTANTAKNIYDSAIAANTRATSAQTAAVSAYSNAIAYSSNASNLSNGIIPDARIVGSYTGITSLTIGTTVANTTTVSASRVLATTANVSGNMTVSGNLVVSGTTTSVGTALASGDSIPIVDNLYSLGNTTNRWITYSSNVFVSSTVDAVNLTLGSAQHTTGSTSTSGTTAQLIDSFSASLYRSAKYIMSIADGAVAGNYNCTEILLMHDGTDAYITEYATLASVSLAGVFSANVSGTTARLYYTPIGSSTTIKYTKTLVEV